MYFGEKEGYVKHLDLLHVVSYTNEFQQKWSRFVKDFLVCD